MYLSEREQDASGSRPVALCEVLDRVLNKGVVVSGQVTISVADVDLIYLGLQLVLTSMETARQGAQPVQPRGLGLKLALGGEEGQ